MTRITRLEFRADSGPGSRMQWNHRGSGHVQVTVDGPDVFFQEAFTLDNGLPCQDRKCWHFGEEGIIFRHFREQRFQDILLLVPDAGGIHLVAQHPDDFIFDLLDLHPAHVCEAAANQRRALKNPPKSVDEYLDTLMRQGLTQTVGELRRWKVAL